MNGYTGRLLEEEALGVCRAKAGPYQSWKKALAAVLANQPWDPSDPGPRFASDLHAEVALCLGLEDWSVLRYYTAVGSDFDVWHGVDAFLIFQGEMVTIDVTTNPEKLNGYKADFIVGPEAIWDAATRESLAREIASVLVAERRRSVARSQPR